MKALGRDAKAVYKADRAAGKRIQTSAHHQQTNWKQGALFTKRRDTHAKHRGTWRILPLGEALGKVFEAQILREGPPRRQSQQDIERWCRDTGVRARCGRMTCKGCKGHEHFLTCR